jgi:hypothetical protein
MTMIKLVLGFVSLSILGSCAVRGVHDPKMDTDIARQYIKTKNANTLSYDDLCALYTGSNLFFKGKDDPILAAEIERRAVTCKDRKLFKIDWAKRESEVERGNLADKLRLGITYIGKWKGIKTHLNYAQGRKWLQRVANHSTSLSLNPTDWGYITRANLYLGYLSEEGYGVEANLDDALNFYKKAKNAHSRSAQKRDSNLSDNYHRHIIRITNTLKQKAAKEAKTAPQMKSPPILKSIDLKEAKTTCTDLGFKKGTEKFGDCVLKLSN